MRRPFRRLLLAAALLGAFAALAALGLFALRRSAERIFLSELSLYLQGDVAASRVELEPALPGLRIRGLEWRPPESGRPALVVERLDVSVEPLSVAAGRARPTRILAARPRLELAVGEGGAIRPLDRLTVRPVGPVPTVLVADGALRVRFDRAVREALGAWVNLPEVWEARVPALSSYPLHEPSEDRLGFSLVAVCSPLGALRLEGGVGRDGLVRATASVRGLDLGDEALRALWPEKSPLRRAVGGTLEARARVAGLAPGAPPPEVRFEAEWREGRLRLPEYATTLEDVALRVEGSRRSVRVVEARARLEDPIADVLRADGEVRTASAGWSGNASFRLARADAEWLRARLAGTALGPVVEQWAPRGAVGLAGRLEFSPAGWAGSVAVEALGASASFEGPPEGGGFPYRLERLTGRVVVTPKVVLIEGLEGVHRGGGRARIDGRVALDGPDWEVHLRADDVPVDEGLRSSLEEAAPALAPLVEALGEQGRTSFDLRLRGGDRPLLVEGRVELQGCSIWAPEGPPVARGAHAVIALDAAGWRLASLEAHMFGGRLEAEATLDPAGGLSSLEGTFRLRGAALADPSLRAWLAEMAPPVDGGSALLGALAAGAAEGRFDLDGEVRGTAQGEIRYEALLTLQGVDLLPPLPPIPLHGIVGRLAVEGAAGKEGARLEGRLLDAVALAAGGRVRAACAFSGRGLGAALLEATDLGISDTLVLALLGQSPEPGREPDVRGQARASLAWRRPSGGGAGFLAGAFEHGRLHGPAVPGAGLSEVAGRFEGDLNAGPILVSDASGRIESAGRFEARRVTLTRYGSAWEAAFSDVEARVSVGEGLLPWLPVDVAALLGPREPEGEAVVRLGEGSIRADRDRGGFRVGRFRVAGRLDVPSLAFGRPVLVDEFAGSVRFDGEGDLRRPGSSVFSGRVRDLVVRSGEVTLDGLDAEVRLSGRVFALENVRGRFAGGAFEPARTRLEVESGDPGAVRGSVVLHGADLRLLVPELGFAPRQVEGRVDVALEFESPVGQPENTIARGSLQVREGDLSDLPLLAALYRVSLGPLLGAENRPAFRSADVEFRFERGLLFVDRFELTAPVRPIPLSVSVKGGGVIGPTGVDLTVTPRLFGVDVPLIGRAVELLKSGLLRVRVYGPLANPRTVYWNAAADLLAERRDVSGLPRLAPRPQPEWSRRF